MGNTLRFTLIERDAIRKEHAEGASAESLQRKHGASATTILSIIKRIGKIDQINYDPSSPDHNKTVRYSVMIRDQMRKDWSNGASYVDIAKHYGCTMPTVVKIVNRYSAIDQKSAPALPPCKINLPKSWWKKSCLIS